MPVAPKNLKQSPIQVLKYKHITLSEFNDCQPSIKLDFAIIFPFKTMSFIPLMNRFHSTLS